jgi:hypothetical protein
MMIFGNAKKPPRVVSRGLAGRNYAFPRHEQHRTMHRQLAHPTKPSEDKNGARRGGCSSVPNGRSLQHGEAQGRHIEARATARANQRRPAKLPSEIADCELDFREAKRRIQFCCVHRVESLVLAARSPLGVHSTEAFQAGVRPVIAASWEKLPRACQSVYRYIQPVRGHVSNL